MSRLGEMRTQIRTLVEKRRHVSFAELAQYVQGFDGDFDYRLAKLKNIVLWAGLSADAGDVINELLDAEQIHMEPCSVLVYAIDGAALRLPLAKQARDYKTPHWLPVAFEPGPKEDGKPSRRRSV